MADATLLSLLTERSVYHRSRNRDLEDINTADALDAAIAALNPAPAAPPPTTGTTP